MEYKGQYVLTTQQVADILGATPVRIRQSLERNAEYFVEGKHHFKLTGEELKAAKGLLGDDQQSIRMILSY